MGRFCFDSTTSRRWLRRLVVEMLSVVSGASSRFSINLLLVLAAVLSISGCERPPPEPIKVGVILPLSGDYEIYGSAGLRGAELAVEEINRAGGVLGGRPLELVIGDNRTDPSESIRLARRLIQIDRVVALMGPVSSAARDAVLEEARSHKTPLLYGIDYEGGVFDRYLFCYSTIPDHYIAPILPYILDRHGRSVFIFGYDYVWPHKLASRVEQEVPRLGGEVVGKSFTRFGVKDFAPVLSSIRASGADVLVLIQPGVDGFEFIRQFKSSGLGEQVAILAIAADEDYLRALPAADLEGIYTGLHFFASLQTERARAFVRQFQARYGSHEIPTYATESHYGLIRLLAAAIEKSGSTDKERIIDAMAKTGFDSGGGRVRARADHHFDLPMFLARFTDGELPVLKSLGVISPSDQRSVPNEAAERAP